MEKSEGTWELKSIVGLRHKYLKISRRLFPLVLVTCLCINAQASIGRAFWVTTGLRERTAR